MFVVGKKSEQRNRQELKEEEVRKRWRERPSGFSLLLGINFLSCFSFMCFGYLKITLTIIPTNIFTITENRLKDHSFNQFLLGVLCTGVED